MIEYTTFIIDGTVIGEVLRISMISFQKIKLSPNKHDDVVLLPQRKKESEFKIEIAHLIDEIGDHPLLILINLGRPIIPNTNTKDINGIDILEFVRLRRTSYKTVIILYSFEDVLSSCIDNRLSQYLYLPNHFYVKMPFRIKSLIQKIDKFSFAEHVKEDFGNRFLSEKAMRISRQYLRDFKHDIVDNMLSNLKADISILKGLKYRYFMKFRILALFCDPMSKFIGRDMKTTFSNEYKLLQAGLKNIENASGSNVIHRNLDKITENLISVLNMLADDKNGTWPEDFTYEQERQTYKTCLAGLKDLLKDLWEADLWKLYGMQYIKSVRELKNHITQYYDVRLEMENVLWRLSVWELNDERRRRLDQIISQLLDPFMERIEHGDYEGALRAFDVAILEALNIPRNATLNKILQGGHYD